MLYFVLSIPVCSFFVRCDVNDVTRRHHRVTEKRGKEAVLPMDKQKKNKFKKNFSVKITLQN